VREEVIAAAVVPACDAPARGDDDAAVAGAVDAGDGADEGCRDGRAAGRAGTCGEAIAAAAALLVGDASASVVDRALAASAE